VEVAIIAKGRDMEFKKMPSKGENHEILWLIEDLNNEKLDKIDANQFMSDSKDTYPKLEEWLNG
jgi:hypothetical protein